jgi:hypothetical protein
MPDPKLSDQVLQHGLTGLLSFGERSQRVIRLPSAIAFNEPRYGINEVVSLH